MFVQNKVRAGKIKWLKGRSSEGDGKRGIVITNALIYIHIYKTFGEINIWQKIVISLCSYKF